MGSITRSSPSLLGVRSPVGGSVDAAVTLPGAVEGIWEDALSDAERASILLVVPEAGGNTWEVPDRTGEAALLPADFGLKNPAKVFWPEVAVPEGVAEDLERLMGEIERGCDLLRDSDGGPPF
jgi:hypothetical protein